MANNGETEGHNYDTIEPLVYVGCICYFLVCNGIVPTWWNCIVTKLSSQNNYFVFAVYINKTKNIKTAMRCRDSRSKKKAGKQGRYDSIKLFSIQPYPTYLSTFKDM